MPQTLSRSLVSKTVEMKSKSEYIGSMALGLLLYLVLLTLPSVSLSSKTPILTVCTISSLIELLFARVEDFVFLLNLAPADQCPKETKFFMPEVHTFSNNQELVTF